jgi:hypothetical protein
MQVYKFLVNENMLEPAEIENLLNRKEIAMLSILLENDNFMKPLQQVLLQSKFGKTPNDVAQRYSQKMQSFYTG